MARLPQHLKQSLNIRVKRRLFGDEYEQASENINENSNLLNLCSAVEQSARAEGEKTTLNNIDDTKNILIITTFQDTSDVKLLSEQASLLYDNANVLYCLPENSFLQCDKIQYKLIYTDVDLSTSNDTLRIIMSIRKNSTHNKTTPIIAVRQTHHTHANDLAYYGISEVFRGELSVEMVRDIMLKYKCSQDEIISKEKELVVVCDEKVENEPNTSVSSSSSTTTDEQINICSMSPTFPMENRLPVKFTTVVLPTTQTRRIVRPIMQRQVLPKPHVNMAQVYPTPPSSVETIRRSPFISPAGQFNSPHCFSYMVSGVPGSAGMKLSPVEEDHTKHSTKERLRRERIKLCCEQMRSLLPTTNGKKIDMASVFELSVLYMKVIQTHSPAILIDKCGEIFKSATQKVPEKRKLHFNDGLVNPIPLPPPKRRNQTNQSLTISPTSSPQTNAQGHCLGSTLHHQPHPYRFIDRPESLYSHVQPNHPRSALPTSMYPGMEYCNYSYESMTAYPGQLGHQISLAASTTAKESPILNEVPLNIPIEYAQHANFYPHY